ncbi:Ig-like domain-containing protein [Paraglaciecola aquimarina]|uniref:Ig-like domain-containing protein n=1 Tax=Paraglaciecola aquimarina TaxID=1235557 RepID=A0ABU3SSZ6_9ALTE|nr:Ig-like domain-containing protein [Paraglaciecola aquimarina]MDU0353103.1 Ig-like domain-containing protein [Paraglaciecola aquimarina]
MQLKNVWFYSLLCSTLTLCSCGGVSGDNGDDPFGTGTDSDDTTSSYTLTLSTLDEQCSTSSQSFTADQNSCVQARLLQDGSPVQGEIVTFSNTLGTLSVSSKLTNADGVAQITLSNNDAEVGAGVLTATYDGESTDHNYEYLFGDSSIEQTAAIQVTMFSNGIGVNRFQADSQVQLQTEILDANDTPIARRGRHF